MSEWAMLMAEGAGVGVLAGLAWARWARREWIKVENGDLRVFGILGAICTALFLFYVYTDTPDGRNNKNELGFYGSLLLAGAGMSWLAKPFVRPRKQRRLPPAESEG